MTRKDSFDPTTNAVLFGGKSIKDTAKEYGLNRATLSRMCNMKIELLQCPNMNKRCRSLVTRGKKEFCSVLTDTRYRLNQCPFCKTEEEYIEIEERTDKMSIATKRGLGYIS